MRVAKDGKLIGTHNDGTVKKAGVGVYEITFNTGPTGSKVPLDIENCAVFATTRVQSDFTPEEVAVDADVQRLGGARIYVETTRPVPYGDNKDHAVRDERQLRRGRHLLRQPRAAPSREAHTLPATRRP